MHATLSTKTQQSVLPRQISQIFERYTVCNWSPWWIYFGEVLLQPLENFILLFLMATCNMNTSTNLLHCSAFLGKKRKLPLFPIRYFRLPIKVKNCCKHTVQQATITIWKRFHCFTEVRQHRADLKWLTLPWIMFKSTTEGRNPTDIITLSTAAPPCFVVNWSLLNW